MVRDAEPPSVALASRLERRPSGWLDIDTTLRHFAIITFAVPAERLALHVPADRFEVPTFPIGGASMALVSAVPFVDNDFRFARLLPFVRMRFCQTNFRAYVIDRISGEHVVWFFGTSLGSWTVHPARWLWRIPWHPARYETTHDFDADTGRYRAFRYRIASDWCDADLDVEDTGETVTTGAGFDDPEQWRLVLTHPVEGYFRRLDGRLGTYAIWHDAIAGTRGTAKRCYFSPFERLNLLTRAEMSVPHSIVICPRTTFHIYMPPRLA